MKLLKDLSSVSLGDRAYLPPAAGVYIAATPDQLLYVGQSANMRDRWIQHHKLDRLTGFSGVRLYYLLAPQGFCGQLESALIRQFAPLLNESKGEVPLGYRFPTTRLQPAPKVVYTAELPIYHYKRFLLWAFSDRKSKANLAKDVLVARVEANQALIDLKLEEVAKSYGITVEDLVDKVIQADLGPDKKTAAQLEAELEKLAKKVQP